MYRTFNKSTNNTRLKDVADTLEGRVAIQNDLGLTETSWEHSLKTNLLVSSSAENDQGVLDNSRQDMNQQPTWHQWELTPSWALATEAQPEGWGKQLFCFVYNPLLWYLDYFWIPTMKYQPAGASSVKGHKDIWQLEHMPCDERLKTLGLFSLEKALEHLTANFQYLEVNY